MAESEREIQVRTLSGESTTISISPNRTIQDLKLLLKQSFLPAKKFPNFHLFFKSAKMSPDSKINSYSIDANDLIVFMPFMKKDRNQTQSQPWPKTSVPSSVSSNADSAWSDLMQDLSSLPNPLGRDNVTAPNSPLRKRKSRSEEQEEALKDVLKSNDKNVLDERITKVIELAECLCDKKTGKCLLSVLGSGAQSCVCPSWLKTILKTFSFLNMFSGFLQMQGIDVTWSRLDGAMKKLCVGVADVKHLSILCPEIVKLGPLAIEVGQSVDVIAIVDSPTKQGDHLESLEFGRKRTSASATINVIKKRESAFKSNLYGSVRELVGQRMPGNKNHMLLALDDLLNFMNDCAIRKRDEAKRARANGSIASNSGKINCCDTSPLLPLEMIEHLRKGIGSYGQIVHVEKISARLPVHVEIPDQLSEITRSALKSIGVSRLYSHQAESIQASLSGKSVVVATMTSSGKSLCYNIPVLEALCLNTSSCALYLFPTKALAQDQIRALSVMTERLDISINIGVYDGDTSQEDRKRHRDNARLLVTNPDMLHMSILPFHAQFHRILSNLRFVIIDEAHTYKGAFGCHTALILRRLRRLCSHVYGCDPSFIFSTATSANPREHAMELAGLSTLEMIKNDGSPSGPKLFVLWNLPQRLTVPEASSRMETPKSSDAETISRRSSPILEVSRLFAEMVQHRLRCIAFCKTRKLCELVLSYTREILQKTAPHLVESICAYRGGYTAEDRRRIESEFFGGKLCGVAATNALELGIDVGHIDATLHLGFPGSISSLWQQAGRSGRRERPSLAVYVAFEGPLDQYFMKCPEKLFKGPIECCHIDAQNKQVLEQHLACAAVEHPLSLLYDECFFGTGLSSALTILVNKGYLSFDPSRDSSARIWNYIGREQRPSYGIGIRAIETEKYKVMDEKRNELLEEIEESKAFFQVYEGAAYMHQGKTYLVKNLDLSAKIALCQEADLKYYTKTRDYTDVRVIGGDIAYPAKISDTHYSRTTAQAHNCEVTTTWFGFFRICRRTKQILDTVELSLPKYTYQSQAVWIRVPQTTKAAVENQNLSFRSGLHAAAHAVLNVVPLFIRCNSSDLTSECANPHETRYFPERVLLYDRHPGGSGLSAQVQPLFRELLTAALNLLKSCCCSEDVGCPNCVQILSCQEYNEVIHKGAAIMILQGVIDAEDSHFQKCSGSSETETNKM